MRIIFAFTLFVVLTLLYCDATREDAAIAQDASSLTSTSNPEKASNIDSLGKKIEKRQLQREGTTAQSQHVIFRVAGNRVVMTVAQGSDRFFCLENLNLQRVTDVLSDNPTLTDWTVDYIVTEYKGENYILIQRAVLTSTALRPTGQEKPYSQ